MFEISFCNILVPMMMKKHSQSIICRYFNVSSSHYLTSKDNGPCLMTYSLFIFVSHKQTNTNNYYKQHNINLKYTKEEIPPKQNVYILIHVVLRSRFWHQLKSCFLSLTIVNTCTFIGYMGSDCFTNVHDSQRRENFSYL